MDLHSLNKFVINLSERTDRREQVEKELAGWKFSYAPGFMDKDPMKGIAKAHTSCIYNAQFLNWSEVLIMEDDVVIRKGAEEYLNEALNNVPEDWEILLGGVYESKGLTPFNDYWNRTAEFCGLHFYIVRNTAYNKILAYDNKLHIDRWMNYLDQGLRCYVLKKFIATQREGFSDNVKSYKDYSDKLKKFKLL